MVVAQGWGEEDHCAGSCSSLTLWLPWSVVLTPAVALGTPFPALLSGSLSLSLQISLCLPSLPISLCASLPAFSQTSVLSVCLHLSFSVCPFPLEVHKASSSEGCCTLPASTPSQAWGNTVARVSLVRPGGVFMSTNTLAEPWATWKGLEAQRWLLLS